MQISQSIHYANLYFFVIYNAHRRLLNVLMTKAVLREWEKEKQNKIKRNNNTTAVKLSGPEIYPTSPNNITEEVKLRRMQQKISKRIYKKPLIKYKKTDLN